MGARKQNFRDELRDFAARKSGDNFDRFNDFQRSQWMTRAYLELILGIMNPGLIPEDEEDVASSFVDAPSDAGVDFLVRADGHVLIIQAKYHKHNKSESESDFDYFCNVLSRLHPVLGRRFKVSTRVKELVSDIDWENDTFELQFLTLGKVNDNIRAREKIGQHSLKEVPGIDERVDIVCCDESDVNQLLREAATAAEQISQPIELQFASNEDEPPWITYEGSTVSYIGYVKAAHLRNLYAKHKYRLFAQNIRNYVGDTSTNKGIINTALQHPDRFFFFNNGVSAIATSIEPDDESRILKCTRFSVINGAQTVRSIAKAHTKEPHKAGEAAVLMRVSEVKLSDDDFLDKVTRYNNTQNAVKVSDFRSNDPVQRALAKKFAKLYRGGRQYWYKNKRSGERDPRRIPIGMEEFVKTIFAFRFGPSDMFGGTAHVFDSGKDGGYLKLFATENEIWTTVTDEQFNGLAGTWFLCERVRQILKEEKEKLLQVAQEEAEKTIIKSALERRWLVFFTVGEILRQKYRRTSSDLENDLGRLAKPKWLDQTLGTNAEVTRYSRVACEVLVKIYRTAAKSSDFVHRNWFRSRDTLSDIASELQYSSTLLDTLHHLSRDQVNESD